MRTGLVAFLLAMLVLAAGTAEPPAWQPKQAPLMTGWAAEVSATNAHPEYPRPQLVRPDWISLNGLWQYAIQPTDSGPPARFAGSILVPFPIESALSGVMKPLGETETLWYRRLVAVPPEWKTRRIRLHFGAVDWFCRVFVNGQFIGQHRGGYSRFGFDITGHLAWNGAEEILVEVRDPTEGDQPRGKQSRKPEGIFYSANSGIWQSVWLEPVPETSVNELILTPDIDAGRLHVSVLANSSTDDLQVETLALAEGVEVSRTTGSPNSELLLPIPNLRLWSPDEPFLYDLQVTLRRNGQLLDQVSSYFGMRKVGLVRNSQGFAQVALNNQLLFQVGALDHGYWPDGIYTAPTDAAARADIAFLKSAGFNLVRKHVKIEPERWYYWCDRLGLLVWQDMPSGNCATPQGRQQFETELIHMLKDLHNHPSLICWVLFNESWGQHDTKRLTQRIKELDPSRLVDNASGWIDAHVGDLADLHNYPGPLAPAPEAARAAVLGEFGGVGFSVANHAWSPAHWSYAMEPSLADLKKLYSRLLDQAWDLRDVRSLSAVVFTQTTDVETECNGLLTYDRAVCKIPAAFIASVNQGTLHSPLARVLVPSARFGQTTWKFTLARPGTDWVQADFDDSNWKAGIAGFGAVSTPGALVRTPWETSDIWLRYEFRLDQVCAEGVKLDVHHDDDAELYLNGELAATLPGFATHYAEYEPSPRSVAALRPGKNVLAVHCHQISGGQYIDAGLVVRQTSRTAPPP